MPEYYKVLDNGQSVIINAKSEDEAKLILREKNLASKLREKEIAYKASPDYQPGATLEKENIGFWGSVGRGATAGAVTGITEIGSTIGLGLQALGAEEEGQNIENKMQAIQETFAPDIEGLGLSAEIPKLLFQFGLPGVAVLRAAKGANAATKAMALGSAEGLAAESDMKTMGDTWFGGGPTATKDLQSLEGQELAYAKLYNKGMVGLEALGVMTGVPIALRAAVDVGADAAQVAARVPGVKQAANAVNELGSAVSASVKEIEKNNPLIRKALSSVRFRGELPDKTVAEIKALRGTQFAAMAQQNNVALQELNNTFKVLTESGKANGMTLHRVMDSLDNYMYPPDDMAFNKAAKDLIEMDKDFGFVKSDKLNVNTPVDNIRTEYSLFRSAKRSRELIDQYSKDLLDNPEFLPEGAAETIAGQLGMYGTRQYRIFLQDDYVPTEEVTKKAVNALMKVSSKGGEKLTESQARAQLYELINKNGFNSASINPKDLVDDKVMTSVMQGPLKARTLNDPAIRDFLGEYTARRDIAGRKLSLEERKIGLLGQTKETLARQAAISSKGNYFKALNEYNDALPSASKIFLDEPPIEEYLRRDKRGRPDWIQIGGEGREVNFGPLNKKWVRREYFEALDKTGSSWYQSVPVLGAMYSTFLGLKGASQMAKTVYNPTGQIRNVTSAMGFSLANGNVPNGKSLTQAFETVSKNIKDKAPTDPDFKKTWEEYIQRGVVGQQAQLGELRSLIDEAAEVGVGKKLFNVLQNQQDGMMAKLYQSGDDVWRVFNYETELSKLKAMVTKAQVKGNPFTMRASTLEQMKIAQARFGDNYNRESIDISKLSRNELENFLKEEAAFVTRDVVPNYARVPTVIQGLRKLPLGNFIAYPAEIIRTTGNIVGRSIKEIASDNPELRARGIERLSGVTAMTAVLPVGATKLGISLTGSSEDQLDAYRRSFAWPWDKNATLIPVKTDKDGNVLEVINGSYTFPYDYLSRVAFGVQNAVDNGVRSEKELNEIAMDIMDTVVLDFFEPFFGESMITERLLDLGARGGKTRFGTSIYNPEDNLGEKAWGGITHVINGLIPQMSPVEFETNIPIWESTGFDAPWRSLKYGDLPQSVLVESKLIDPKYRVSERGKQLDFFNEMGQAMSGVKTIKMDIERSLGYKAEEAKAQIRAANEDYRRLKKAYGPRIPEEALAAYKKANERRYKALRDLSVALDDARLIGMPESDMVRILKEKKVADWQSVFNHKYIPYAPPPSVYVGAYEADEKKIRNVIPLSDIQEEMERSYNQQQSFPLPPPPEPRLQPLPERMKQQVPSLFNRASQALRDVEIDKLMGTD